MLPICVINHNKIFKKMYMYRWSKPPSNLSVN